MTPVVTSVFRCMLQPLSSFPAADGIHKGVRTNHSHQYGQSQTSSALRTRPDHQWPLGDHSGTYDRIWGSWSSIWVDTCIVAFTEQVYLLTGPWGRSMKMGMTVQSSPTVAHHNLDKTSIDEQKNWLGGSEILSIVFASSLLSFLDVAFLGSCSKWMLSSHTTMAKISSHQDQEDFCTRRGMSASCVVTARTYGSGETRILFRARIKERWLGPDNALSPQKVFMI